MKKSVSSVDCLVNVSKIKETLNLTVTQDFKKGHNTFIRHYVKLIIKISCQITQKLHNTDFQIKKNCNM